MKVYEFEKIQDGWYIVLPEYLEIGGEQADLAMVAGADTMLEMLAGGKDRVRVIISLNHFYNCDTLKRTQLLGPGGGAMYFVATLNGIEINLSVWLCAVTEFIFGSMPENIYIKQVGS